MYKKILSKTEVKNECIYDFGRNADFGQTGIRSMTMARNACACLEHRVVFV